MLKIKDNIDLKELEKFGFDNFENCIYKDFYLNDKEIVLRVDKTTKEVKCWSFLFGNMKDPTPYIQDLIQAGLVEKEVK